MDISIQLKQIVSLGLACLTCVVVIGVARFVEDDTEDQFGDLEQSASVQASLEVSEFHPIDEFPIDELPIASRIPDVDNATQAYPVQQAAYDSISWDSEVITPNRISTPTDVEPRGQQTKIKNLKALKTGGQRIAGLSDTSSIESNSDSNPFVGEITLNPEYARQNAPANSNQPFDSQVLAAQKRIKGIDALVKTIKGNPTSPGPQIIPGSKRGNQNRAVVTNQFYQSDAKVSSAEAGEMGVNNTSDLILSASENSTDFQVEPANHSTQFAKPDSSPTNEPTRSLLEESNSSNDRWRQDSQINNDVASHLAMAPTRTMPRVTSSNLNPSPPARPSTEDPLPKTLVGAENFKLAEQPKFGDHWHDDRPVTDRRAIIVDSIKDDFSPDPIDAGMPYDPYSQMQVYDGKTLNATQRPIVELGRPWYQLGQLSPGYSWFGKYNNATPQFLVYGDARTAMASNSQNGDSTSALAFELNLDFDLKLTSTERFHMFMAPLDDGQENTRWVFDDEDFVEAFDANIDFGYFEGDLGAIVGGFTNQSLPFDLPFAVGVMPLVLQNGVWMEDAFLGIAATIPARSSPKFNISNMDVTFFAGYDKINSDAFVGDDSAARMYGIASFIDAMNGYFEIDYAFLDDRTLNDRSYHNIGIGFSRRYGRLFSNSTRVIINAGQSTDVVENSADGVLLLSENSLITSSPSTVVPYLNLFAGFDRPQSAARAAAAGGILRNTGILFETDGMTNYPTLDPTANDTFGGAFGLNLLANDFSQQLIVEMAALGVMGEDANRNAANSQLGVAFRYQLPLTNAMIFRTDGMYGFLEDQSDVKGIRVELRHKY